MQAGDGLPLATITFGVGILAGVALVAMLPGMPWAGTIIDADTSLDLAAQRSMASAAWYMAAISAASLIVGSVSLWLLRENIIEARKVTAEAGRSAAAAEEAVVAAQATSRETRELGTAQARAYIIGEAFYAKIGWDYPIAVAQLRITIRNAGQTPAQEVFLTWQLFVAYDEGAVRRETALGSKIDMPQDIAAGATYTDIFNLTLSQEESWVIELSEKTFDFVLRGTATYRDVFRVFNNVTFDVSATRDFPQTTNNWSQLQRNRGVFG